MRISPESWRIWEPGSGKQTVKIYLEQKSFGKEAGPVAKRDRTGGIWEMDFEDISSNSHSAPIAPREPRPVREDRSFRPREERRPARPVRRPPPDWEIPEWDMQNRRRFPEPGRTSSSRPRRQPQPERRPSPSSKKRGKKPPVRPGVRRAMLFFTVLFMTTVTVLLAIFLLFKISTIQITGDVTEKYGTDEILRVSGCKTGENLVFFPAGSRENTLKAQH